jgi:hypothetical protein
MTVGRAMALVPLALALATGCGSGPQSLEPEETFNWVTQPIAFSPPPQAWRRQGDNGGGTLGVRFILSGGGGQCIGVAAYRTLAERERRTALQGLIERSGSLSRREFLRELSLARARTDEPLSEREAATAREINAAIDRATARCLADGPPFATADLEAALRAESAFEPTLEEVLPRIRLQPHRMHEPERWRIGYERDTTIAGRPAFAGDDTLITPERPLLYREIFWVVHGCAFEATFQGLPDNLPAFYRLVDSIRFPEATDAAPP